jgi:G3E family GTPase
MDHLFTLNEHTPKIKCVNGTEVDPLLLFGIDSKLFQLDSSPSASHHFHNHSHSHSGADVHHHEQHEGSQHDEVETATILSEVPFSPLGMETLEIVLAGLPKDVVYRVKGFIPLIPSLIDAQSTAGSAGSQSDVQTVILNWAFGRFETTSLAPLISQSGPTPAELKLTIMGERGEIRRKWAVRLANALGGRVAS